MSTSPIPDLYIRTAGVSVYVDEASLTMVVLPDRSNIEAR